MPVYMINMHGRPLMPCEPAKANTKGYVASQLHLLLSLRYEMEWGPTDCQAPLQNYCNRSASL